MYLVPQPGALLAAAPYISLNDLDRSSPGDAYCNACLDVLRPGWGQTAYNILDWALAMPANPDVLRQARLWQPRCT
jgi:hypothetical protein